ncbi:MAG TPA: CHRD domain-containing protein, partial [Anaerolineales bacterium]
MGKRGSLFVTVLLFAATVVADTTETRYFSASMSPANEVPPATGVTASGQATITLVVLRSDSGSVVSGVAYFDVDYSVSYPSPEGVILTGLHIHNGPAGVAAGVVISSGLRSSESIPAQGTGNIFRQANVTSGAGLGTLADLPVNPANYYVNLHSTVHPDGFLRGQLQPSTAPPPSVEVGALVNAASFAVHPAPLAPGSIAALFGKYLNDGSPAFPAGFEPDGKLGTTLGGTQVRINGVAVPLFFSFFNLVALQIPTELAGTTSATVQIVVGGRTSATRTFFVEPAAPGIFTANASGQGAGIITHLDYSLVTPQSPAQPDEIVILWGTGLGVTDPPLATGEPATFNEVPKPTVTLDGVPLTVLFAGRAGSSVGLDQLILQLPASMPSGSEMPMRITVGSRQSNQVSTAVGAAAPPPPPPPPP